MTQHLTLQQLAAALVIIAFATTPVIAKDPPTSEQLVEWSESVYSLAEAHVGSLRDELLLARSIQDQKHAIRNWMLNGFHSTRVPQPRTSAPPQIANRASLLRHWERKNKLLEHRFIDLPTDISRGGIRNGTALNYFITTCGSAAVEHVTVMDGGKPTVHVDKYRNEIWATLQQLDQETTIANGSFLLKEIQCVYGLSGSRLPIRLQAIANQQGAGLEVDPFPLEWPNILLGEPRFSSNLKEIQSGRDAVLLSLANENRPEVEIQIALMEAVDSLVKEWKGFQRDRRLVKKVSRDMDDPEHRVKHIPKAWNDADVIRAMKFVSSLRYGVGRLLEMEELRMIGGAESFLRPNDRLSIPGLLAYMYENTLRFAPAEADDEVAYKGLFEGMRRYHKKMLGLQAAVRDADGDVASLEGELVLTAGLYTAAWGIGTAVIASEMTDAEKEEVADKVRLEFERRLQQEREAADIKIDRLQDEINKLSKD